MKYIWHGFFVVVFAFPFIAGPVRGWDDLSDYAYDDFGWYEARGTWLDMTSAPNVGAYGEAMIGTGDNLYVIRCATASSTPYLWRYNPLTDN